MKHYFLTVGLLLCFVSAYPQAKVRRMAEPINHPSMNVSAPFISLDGNTIVYITDYSDEGNVLYASTKQGVDWKDPYMLPKTINNRLNFFKGFTLMPDGKTLCLTSLKSNGVGNFDIWFTNLQGTNYTNPGSPINSKSNDGSPTFTPDGMTMYFMRCDKMTQQNADGCKIFMAKKKITGQWEEPIELPASINTGNSQTPRIMADGVTLIFSTNKISPNKGGMDLFVSKLQDEVWSEPKPLDFVNTEKDDQLVSAISTGRYLLKDAPGTRRNEIYEYLMPEDIRPHGVKKVEGKITDVNGAGIASYISVTDLTINKRVYSGRPSLDGSYLLYLNEGGFYELAIDPEQSNITYFAKLFDLTSTNVNLNTEKLNVTLKQIAPDDEISLDQVKFRPYSHVLDQTSEKELGRLVRLAKNNPVGFEIKVMLEGYVEDSVRSSPDLTEMIVDSVLAQIEDIDTLGQLYTRDSTYAVYTYHNDRTAKQAESIITFLVNAGLDPNSLTSFVNARPEAVLENRKILVKAVVRAGK
ncbi:MAG: hypothetical protein L0Y35_03735 [Flammeovirgaceae bacterium]|nr:hypothetical protein [Flammeovirgaceae bacterium]